MTSIPTDTIVEHLFTKIDNICSLLSETREELSAVNAKLTVMEASAAEGAKTMVAMDQRISALEARVTKLQSDWKWVAGILSFIGAVVGFITNACIELLGR